MLIRKVIAYFQRYFSYTRRSTQFKNKITCNKLIFYATNKPYNRITKMKKNKGTTLTVIGMMFTTLGLTVMSDNQVLKYGTLILGIVFTFCSVLVFDKERKSKKKSE